MKMNKWKPKAIKQNRRSIPVEYKGIHFDSQTEANYFRYLEKDKTVLNIVCQPRYQIIEPYVVRCRKCNGAGKKLNIGTSRFNKCVSCKGKGKKSKGGAIYTADFFVTYVDGYTEVIDVKGGPVERDFPLRKKLLESETGQEVIVVRYKDREWVRE